MKEFFEFFEKFKEKYDLVLDFHYNDSDEYEISIATIYPELFSIFYTKDISIEVVFSKALVALKDWTKEY